ARAVSVAGELGHRARLLGAVGGLVDGRDPECRSPDEIPTTPAANGGAAAPHLYARWGAVVL
ncbi:hypothetical protein, partial [Promicromonospora sp. NPDC023987]|uniref:hypothetical protein n=1 Tax=Promicromonospora sp. NPDC023987 TaxID=3155360 RepID=UPI0033C8EABC